MAELAACIRNSQFSLGSHILQHFPRPDIILIQIQLAELTILFW
jgi:hypothetical protein